ncbi:hypothetical protein M8J71_17845 [Pseudarthrobacter sp. R1]|uniref:hypothetical protein n=1 Tax=Pseudarthrobacter sp. R1 TaxID=2944934 RepID=UPI0021086C45|nr:hypothetical protein [Pseudarthrobacter sp. R1]MCQ6272332.1 hypothetical protein [Pseudarthrobacter sp. R1]
MTTTPSKLSGAAGVAAITAGLLYGGIQFVHPVEEVANVTGSAWAIVHYLTVAMGVLGLAGITGMYLKQVQETGLLGLSGFLLLGLFYLTVIANSFVEAFVLPPLAEQAPHIATDILGIFGGAAADGSLGPLEGISTFAFAVYFLGGLTFGVAVFRARVLARWAGILLAVGSVSTALLPLFPHALGRFAALPVGIAVAWLGYSLWVSTRHTGSPAAGTVVPGRGRAVAQ